MTPAEDRGNNQTGGTAEIRANESKIQSFGGVSQIFLSLGGCPLINLTRECQKNLSQAQGYITLYTSKAAA